MDAEAVSELFAAFGPVSVRRMFGGAGVYADGIIIAIIAGGVIYLKADADTVPRFEAEGLGPFTYEARSHKRAVMSYWRMPDRLYDDPDELAHWARDALAAARRAAGAKPRPATRSRSKSTSKSGSKSGSKSTLISQPASRSKSGSTSRSKPTSEAHPKAKSKSRPARKPRPSRRKQGIGGRRTSRA
jgi:DNA transformation protein